MIIGMYCDICEEKGVNGNGFQYFDMELINVEDLNAENSTHTYEGECPGCGTVHQYISYRKEEFYTFCKKESE